jgi:hypothetical protein
MADSTVLLTAVANRRAFLKADERQAGLTSRRNKNQPRKDGYQDRCQLSKNGHQLKGVHRRHEGMAKRDES